MTISKKLNGRNGTASGGHLEIGALALRRLVGEDERAGLGRIGYLVLGQPEF
ncbi:hypothetical protein ACQB60_45495 [Actinomycetota bacterium Odt1-20B]